MAESPSALSDLVDLVDRLLDPVRGCVWNQAQTHASLATYAVEEAYELVDAIDADDQTAIREELGDVLYQVVLHAGIAAHAGRFDLEDVAAGARDKMRGRHPHVFGDEHADTIADVVRVWRAAKAREKADRASIFDGVPRAMPPLERAVKLIERSAEHGAADSAVAAVEAALDGTGTEVAVAGGADGRGAADASWGAGMLRELERAMARGVDPVASLRLAVDELSGQAAPRAHTDAAYDSESGGRPSNPK